MGKQKRKTSSPLQRDEGKNPRIVEEHDEGDEETSREGPSGKTDVIGDLKDLFVPKMPEITPYSPRKYGAITRSA